MMGVGWIDAWSHVFELLAKGKIKWYAVVTYEALVQCHDQVTKELIEVVRICQKHFRDDQKKKLNRRRSAGVELESSIPVHAAI